MKISYSPDVSQRALETLKMTMIISCKSEAKMQSTKNRKRKKYHNKWVTGGGSRSSIHRENDDVRLSAIFKQHLLQMAAAWRFYFRFLRIFPLSVFCSLEHVTDNRQLSVVLSPKKSWCNRTIDGRCVWEQNRKDTKSWTRLKFRFNL